MKLNYTYVAIAIVLGAGAVVGAYQLGQRQQVSENAKQAEAAPEKPASGTEGHVGGVPASAPHAVPAAVSGPRFSHFRVGNRNVKSMYLDGQYVWVGTSGGAIRYDTKTDDYTLFNNKNSGLLSNGIFHISRLGNRMAIGTYGGGLSLYDPEKDDWKLINIPQGLADQFVYDVLKASNGDVWIATWSGANRVRGGDFDNEAAWDTFTVENTNGGLPNPWVYGVKEGLNGDIWLATEGGLALYREGKWNKWGHDDGLGAPLEVVQKDIQFRNDPGKASMHHFRQKAEQGLSGVNVAYNPNYVISLAVQKDGTVWCGTWGAGLARFDGKSWHNFTTEDGLPANHIFMLYVDGQDQLWIGTSKGLARLKKDGGFELKTVADGLYADNVFSMASAKDGSLWIGSFGGVAHIDKGWGSE